MKNSEKLTNTIESVLFVSGKQVEVADIKEKLGVSDKEFNAAVKTLTEKYSGDSGIQLLSFNKKLQFCSNPKYAEDVSSVLNPIKERELSKSMLEVAAIIAYKQPVTRIDLEEIRGNSEYAVQKLLELGVIEPVGRKDAVGKPVLFGTTDEFLKRFQISSLDELPDYDDLITRIQLLHSGEKEDEYLYKKDEYIDESAAEGAVEVAATETDMQENTLSEETEKVGVNRKRNNKVKDDFVLPDFSEEEIPDFLKGEEVEKI